MGSLADRIGTSQDHRHHWDKLGLQKVGTVRKCSRCGQSQVKKQRSDRGVFVYYWKQYAA